MYGELVPLGGGIPILLEQTNLLVGRGPDCDVQIHISTVSSHHCRLILHEGYWRVKDLGSRNGTRVNNMKVDEHVVEPGAVLALANNKFELRYSPADLGATGPPPAEDIFDSPEDIFGHSLFERAGLSGTKKHQVRLSGVLKKKEKR
jgi:pSer/pThr/pTyr-binding forkhead associated (FHA) protein